MGSPPNQSRYESLRGALHLDRGLTRLLNMLLLCRQALRPPGNRSLLSNGVKAVNVAEMLTIQAWADTKKGKGVTVEAIGAQW